MEPAANLPGFRRRISIVPVAGAVTAALEDDFHRMIVTLRHDGARITAVEPIMERAPWDSCPGARAVVIESFCGLPLARALAPQAKRANCTHLYDLAALAGAHALDDAPLTYDIAVSDPVADEVFSQLARNGQVLLDWQMRERVIMAPRALAGLPLFSLRDWIAGLAPDLAEAARMLQWASMIAIGRVMSRQLRAQTDNKPPNCYSFQPERIPHATLTGEQWDFSTSGRHLLEGFAPDSFGASG